MQLFLPIRLLLPACQHTLGTVLRTVSSLPPP